MSKCLFSLKLFCYRTQTMDAYNEMQAPGKNPLRALDEIDFQENLSSEPGLRFESELTYANGAVFKG